MESWFADRGYFNFYLFTISIVALVLLRFSYVYSARYSLKILIFCFSFSFYSKLAREYNKNVTSAVGGNTAEMLNLLLVLDMDKLEPRIYVAADTSLEKAGVLDGGSCREVCFIFESFLLLMYYHGIR